MKRLSECRTRQTQIAWLRRHGIRVCSYEQIPEWLFYYCTLEGKQINKDSFPHKRRAWDDAITYAKEQERSKSMTTKEIVLDWLKSNGYYGLIGEEGCACDIEHLFACGKIPQDCEPGYRHPCHCKNGEHSCHIMPDKPKQRKQKATLELQQKERIDLAESKSYGFYPRIITIFEHDAEMAKCLEVSPIQPQHLRVDAFLEAVGQFERELTRMESLIELIDK